MCMHSLASIFFFFFYKVLFLERDMIMLKAFNFNKQSFQSLFEELRERRTIEELEPMAVLAHNIWLRKNTFIHGGLFKPPLEVLRGSGFT
jgi:hypothetical protein